MLLLFHAGRTAYCVYKVRRVNFKWRAEISVASEILYI